MRYYPLFLNLRGARCLVAGAGSVGRRKAMSLLACSPQEVLVLDPLPLDKNAWKGTAGHTAFRFEQRAFAPEDLEGRSLVFAATSVRAVNSHIASLCQERGILCNVADAQDEGNMLVPARVDSGAITLAVSTGGASPALAKALKEDLETWLGRRYAPLAFLLDKLRPHVLSLNLGSGADAEIFRALCAKPVREQLADLLTKDKAKAHALLLGLLPPALHPVLAELLYEPE